MSNTPKEVAYDEHISPLMEKIIAFCKEHKINMAATFALDQNESGEPLYCTTVLSSVDEADEAGTKRMLECYRVMQPRPAFMAFTIISNKPTP